MALAWLHVPRDDNGKLVIGKSGPHTDFVEKIDFSGLRKLAAGGDVHAMQCLGWCYESGWHTKANAAKSWYRKAADGGPKCLWPVSRSVTLQQRQRAVRWLQKAAKKHIVRAQYALGRCYHKGHGVAADDREALRLWRLSALHGYSIAQNRMGSVYRAGAMGLKKQARIAVKWFRRSAEQGDPTGQMWLGVSRFTGVGVEADIVQAVYWLKKG